MARSGWSAPVLAALCVGVLAVDIALGLSARASLLAALLATAGLFASIDRSSDLRLSAASALAIGAAILLLEHAESLWVLVAAGCLAPLAACVEATACLARVPRSSLVVPPTPTVLRLCWVISGAVTCVTLMTVAGSSDATTRMDLISHLRLVSGVGWLLLPVALIVPWLARLRRSSGSAARSALLVGGATGIAAVAGLIDGNSPLRIVIGASVGAALGWLGTRTGQVDMPTELPLEPPRFIKLAIAYSVLIAALLGCVFILAVWV